MKHFLWVFLVLLALPGVILAQPDPGPALHIAAPASEATLFGHSSDPLHDVIAWSTPPIAGCPVVFSAPWALTTSVHVVCLGHYMLTLTVNGVSASTTLDYLPVESQTEFWVDPNAEHVGDGSALLPWRDFRDNNPNNASQWSAINAALAERDVIVHFSARLADQDIPSTIVGGLGPQDAVIRVKRTDTSTHRLTLDGMAYYNTNPLFGSWVLNTGASRMRLVMTGGCCLSIGWDDTSLHDYVTIRGFEVTGPGGRIVWGGSHSVMEYLTIHDVSILGSTFQFHPALLDGTCIPLGISHDVTIRHNRLINNIGESMYIASNYNWPDDGGCVEGPDSGDNHYDFLIEGNTIDEAGFYGEEGDGIDLKAGIYNVTIRGNFIRGLRGSGITMAGQMPNSTHDSNYLIEGNIIEDAYPPFYSSINIGGTKGLTIRNNVLRNCQPGSYGAIVSAVRQDSPDGTPLTPTNARIQVYNNTIDGGLDNACVGMSFTYVDDVVVLRNNLFLDSPPGLAAPQIDSDFNLFVGTLPNSPEGPNSDVVPTADGIVVARGSDDHLAPMSPAIGQGTPIPSFNVDIGGNPRNPSVWDIGAYAVAR